MPATLWRKLAVEYVGPHAVTAEDGTALPDEVRCRAAHATYAVLATFERAMRLPGLAQDTDRAYGIARFTVRSCLSGTVAPAKILRIESDPLAEPDRAADEAGAARTWERAIRTALAHDPLPLPAFARVARIENGVVFLDGGRRFAVNQVLRDFADGDAKPHAAIELVVIEVSGKYVQAAVTGGGIPHAGDYVEAAK